MHWTCKHLPMLTEGAEPYRGRTLAPRKIRAACSARPPVHGGAQRHANRGNFHHDVGELDWNWRRSAADHFKDW